MFDQNPDCDVRGCNRTATMILFSEAEDGDSLLCEKHWESLRGSDPARADLFGPLNKIVIRQPLPANENA